MIIQSDSMRMSASRSFRSTQGTYYRDSGRNSSGSLMFAKSSTYSRRELYSTNRSNRSSQTAEKLPEDAKNTENEAGALGSNSSGKNNLTNLMERMKGSSGIRRSSLRNHADAYTRIRQQSLNYLLFILFGKRSIESDRNIPTEEEEDSFSDVLAEASSEVTRTPVQSSLSGQSQSLSYYFYYNEEEHTCFDAQGTAVTADGRELSFNISLEMSRSFTEMASQQINYLKPQLCDPLVINLDSNVASVSDQKFFFDIDADGKEESVSMLNSGSGYLALDKNGDGKINDGSELFGTASGNGFKDLSAYDKDHNGWIDEADEIFKKLRIWTKDENGKDQLLTLAEAGVGAIYLGYENTDFSLKSMEDNTTNALIRKTGIFLYENGGSGTVQQLDLAT